MNFGKIPLIYREISSRGSNPSKALHTCLTDMCANTHLYSPHFLTCRLVLQSKNIFPSVSPMVPLTKKSIRAKTCPLIQSTLWHQKTNFILNTYLVIAKNVISEKFPSFAGKFPHGDHFPPTRNFHMPASTNPILNPVPSGLWILENVAILKFPLIRGEISPRGSNLEGNNYIP